MSVSGHWWLLCGLCLWTAKFQFETPATNTTQSTGLFRHGATLTSLASQMTSSFIVAQEMNSGGRLACEWMKNEPTPHHTTPHHKTWRMPVELRLKSHVWVVYHRTCMINRVHTSTTWHWREQEGCEERLWREAITWVLLTGIFT